MRLTTLSSIFFTLVALDIAPESALAMPARAMRPDIAIPISKRSAFVSDTEVSRVANLVALRNEWTKLHTKYDRTLASYEQNVGHPHWNASDHAHNSTRHGAHHHGGGQALNTSSANQLNTGGALNEVLTDSDDELWYGTIEIGTPPQAFTIDFDTGSSDLFVPTASCDSCGNHTRYDPSSSSTSQALGTSFKLQYGDGSTTSGEKYTDVVELAGLTATGQTLGAASSYSTSFQTGPMDGLMGLAFPEISSFGASPFFETLLAQGAIPSGQGQFAFYLSDSGSELHLGGVDDTKFKGNVEWTDVTTVGYWQVQMDALSTGRNGNNAKQALGATSVIVDSGTTLILGTPDDVEKVYSQIPGAKDASDTVGEGFYTFPCNAVPDVSVTFGGKTFDLSTKYLNLGTVSESDTSDCVGAIAGSSSLPFWIMGDAMMRNVYTVFDYDQKRVGFADLAV